MEDPVMNLKNSFSEKQSEQRGERSVAFNPATTAVIVVDMLNDFFKEGGAMVLSGGDVLYEPIQRLTTTARAAGSPVFWTNQWLDPDDSLFRIRTPHCLKGTWGAEIVAELPVAERDVVVPKRRYSAFFQTSLDLSLRERKIETVIVTGVVTNICVRSTVNDAFFLGYRVIVPEECVKATSPQAQEAHLYDIDTHYGDVTTLDAVVAVYEANEAAA
jgi:ureidoacrylate peracid hydrolase